MGRKRRGWEKLEKILKKKEEDAIMPDPRESDLIIPVMGPTGSGKSSFINAVLGKDIMTVGKHLHSCTSNLQHAILPLEIDVGQDKLPKAENMTPRIILLDTPGFDDNRFEDIEILRRIAVWLSYSYKGNMNLAGVIYMHDISNDRFAGSIKRNLQMFRALCGDNAVFRVILTTSKWGRIDPETGKLYHRQLLEEFWRDMLTLKAHECKFEGTTQSAREIIRILFERYSNPEFDHVLMQEEIVDLCKLLSQTDAGRALQKSLKVTAEMHRVFQERLKQWNRADANPELRKQYNDNLEQLQTILRQIEELKIPVGRRLLTFIGLGRLGG